MLKIYNVDEEYYNGTYYDDDDDEFYTNTKTAYDDDGFCAYDNKKPIQKKTLYKTFKDNIGKKVFILTIEFPFMIIGKTEKVKHDYILIDVEVCQVTEFENTEMYVRIDDIKVFYIETANRKIPNIYESDCVMNRGDT